LRGLQRFLAELRNRADGEPRHFVLIEGIIARNLHNWRRMLKCVFDGRGRGDGPNGRGLRLWAPCNHPCVTKDIQEWQKFESTLYDSAANGVWRWQPVGGACFGTVQVAKRSPPGLGRKGGLRTWTTARSDQRSGRPPRGRIIWIGLDTLRGLTTAADPRAFPQDVSVWRGRRSSQKRALKPGMKPGGREYD
jgi:hypothetical protein